jgi:hypothetical protein
LLNQRRSESPELNAEIFKVARFLYVFPVENGKISYVISPHCCLFSLSRFDQQGDSATPAMGAGDP